MAMMRPGDGYLGFFGLERFSRDRVVLRADLRDSVGGG